jgi:hypothetical protein
LCGVNLVLGFVIFFTFTYMGLTQSHYLSRGFSELARVDLSLFLNILFIYFFGFVFQHLVDLGIELHNFFYFVFY